MTAPVLAVGDGGISRSCGAPGSARTPIITNRHSFYTSLRAATAEQAHSARNSAPR